MTDVSFLLTMDKQIIIEDVIKEGCPDYAMIYVEADVENSETTDDLKREFDNLTGSIASLYEIGDVNKRPAIAATRRAYKIFGKDPNRYRPSQEQLMRRVVRGLGLYNVNNLVDAGNLFSLSTGCAVGIFDRDKIQGDKIILGVGREGEPYEGIGRGELNISGMPVIRDAAGGFGTPTSDNERTKTELSTKRISATIHVFDSSSEDLAAITSQLTDLLVRHCHADNIETLVVRL